MFATLSFKKKLIALLVIIFIMGISAYKRSYSKTFNAISELKNSKEQLEVVKNSQNKITSLKNEVMLLDNVIGKHAANPDIVQQEILNTFSQFDTKTELVKLEEVHKAKNNYFNIYTNRLLVSGSYNNVIETCYAFEKAFEYSRVVSLSLYTKKDSRTQRKKLFEQIIFQNYEKIN